MIQDDAGPRSLEWWIEQLLLPYKNAFGSEPEIGSPERVFVEAVAGSSHQQDVLTCQIMKDSRRYGGRNP